ncbi:hypothetical protein QFC21_004508 [Naganishia friedmannii]|uniref:Uncharacterized protein n=1 Tax=Naganishia friedmannii TaxID=89922 RepID=A0ACC2VG94_9TREE|nr:hypothetical protein QFC21_004508 [Naganishia friedmannii]
MATTSLNLRPVASTGPTSTTHPAPQPSRIDPWKFQYSGSKDGKQANLLVMFHGLGANMRTLSAGAVPPSAHGRPVLFMASGFSRRLPSRNSGWGITYLSSTSHYSFTSAAAQAIPLPSRGSRMGSGAHTSLRMGSRRKYGAGVGEVYRAGWVGRGREEECWTLNPARWQKTRFGNIHLRPSTVRPIRKPDTQHFYARLLPHAHINNHDRSKKAEIVPPAHF